MVELAELREQRISHLGFTLRIIIIIIIIITGYRQIYINSIKMALI